MGQGNAFAPCQNKTGQDAVDCTIFHNPDANYNGWLYQNANTTPTAQSEAVSKTKLATMMPPEMVDDYYTFLVNCNSEGGADPESPLFCYTPDFYYKLNYNQVVIDSTPATYGNLISGRGPNESDTIDFPVPFNMIPAAHFHYAMARLTKVCGKFAAEVAPKMYQFYNSPYGKEQIDTYLKSNPDLPSPCADLLKNNYKDENAIYGLVNPPKWESDWSGGGTDLLTDWGKFGDPWGTSGEYAASGGIKDWTDPKFLTAWHNVPLYPNSGPTYPPAYLKFGWGNPTWSHKDRSAFWSAILGTDVATGESFVQAWAEKYIGKGFANAGKGAQTYFNPEDTPGKPGWTTDPTYAGNLPYLPAYSVKGDEPWHHITQDPDAYGYHNNCGKETWIQEIVPIAGGIICGGLAGMFVPGTKARVIATASAASAVYYVAGNILEVQGADYTERGSEIIGAGACATLMQLCFDIGIIDIDNTVVEVSADVMAAAFGFYFVAPRILPSMQFSGGLSRFLFAPLVAIDELVESLFSGCAAHENPFTSRDVCLCEEANVKPLLQQALVGPIFGCTDQQYNLRLACVQAAMTQGLWGEDKYYMGTCDSSGHMDSPIACLSAGEWAYREWPADLDSQAAPMWAQCEHCFDMKNGQPWVNPSFQQPGSQDSPCVQKYGKFFRLGPDGNCYDYRAPVGKQSPGQYAWPDERGHNPLANSNESCTIL